MKKSFSFHLSIQEAKAERFLQVQGQLDLHCEFPRQTEQHYDLVSKTNKQKIRQQEGIFTEAITVMTVATTPKK